MKKKEPKTMWALIEAPDENKSDEIFTHIMPIVVVDGFKTAKEAYEFRLKCIAAGSPVITDDDDMVTGTYFGHTLSKDCPCAPTPRESDASLLTHHQAN